LPAGRLRGPRSGRVIARTAQVWTTHRERAVWHTLSVRRVNWTYLKVCESSHPLIRARWEALLRKEEAWECAQSRPALVGAMDSFLDGLWALLRSNNVPNLVRKVPPAELPIWSRGSCRLNPTLVFLAMGKKAVQIIAQRAEATQSDLPPDERGEQWAELMLAYDVVSQREIQRVCGSCFRRSRCAVGEIHEKSCH
jgi:hypothetical protein